MIGDKMNRATVQYDVTEGLLRFTGFTGKEETRKITEKDKILFKDWITQYGLLRQLKDNRKELLRLGTKIYKWLDGPDGRLEEALDQLTAPPFILQLQVSPQQDPQELAFLEVPWELLAGDPPQFLAAQPKILYCPVRRTGTPQTPPPPPPYRLHTLFIAASPQGVDILDFEREESAILHATGRIGMDLVVEESGNPGLLAETLAIGAGFDGDEPPAVLHISCHGQPGATQKPLPRLMLETQEGLPEPTSAAQLSQTLGKHRPRLLFLSACMTSQPDRFLNTYSATMVKQGMANVLGWSGSVYDTEATAFAREFYGFLSRGETPAAALARARWEMMDKGVQWFKHDEGSRHWHLARLYLGPGGGGVLSGGRRARRRLGPEYGHKEFLDARNHRVPVAGRHEFVGRRRELQALLREFGEPTRGGVLVRGLGRQGKSSLAARAANRLTRRQVVVVYGGVSAQAVLGALAGEPGAPGAAKDMIAARREAAAGDNAALRRLYQDLLLGPLAEAGPAEGNREAGRPVLLVLDDFEQVLEPDPGGGLHRVKPDLRRDAAALLDAFRACVPRSDSRLLVTSRYGFHPPGGEGRLGDTLLELHLTGMKEAESRKQAAARGRVLKREDALYEGERVTRCIAAARGNPGLQEVLFSLCLEAPERCDRALEEVDKFLAGEGEPGDDKVLSFVRNLALEGLIGLLEPGEKELLRASALFGLPVPEAVFGELARVSGWETGDPVGRRLPAFGLWEPFDGVVTPGDRSLALNPLARGWVEPPGDVEAERVAKIVAEPLFSRWGGKDGTARPYAADIELARLALRGGAAGVVAEVGEDAILGLKQSFRYRESVSLAEQVVTCLDGSGLDAPAPLLRAAADAADSISEVALARGYIRRALETFQRAGETESEDYAYGLGTYGRLLQQSGEPGQALEKLEQARELLGHFGKKTESAAAMGYIARILAQKGEVDRAMDMHGEALNIYESLGDRRSGAVTMGDIASILLQQGRTEEAMKLQNQKLGIARELGDFGEQAVALWDLAQIELQRENHKAALPYLSESYSLFLKTGRLEGICAEGLYLGQFACMAGQTEEGLSILKRSRDGFRKMGMMDRAEETEMIIKLIETGG